MRQKWAILICAAHLVVSVLSVPLQTTLTSSVSNSSETIATGSAAAARNSSDAKPPSENPIQDTTGTKGPVSEANMTHSSNVTDSEAVKNESDASKDSKATVAATQGEMEETSAKGGAKGISTKGGATEDSDQETQNPAGDKANATITPDGKGVATDVRNLDVKGKGDTTQLSSGGTSKQGVPVDTTQGVSGPVTGNKQETSMAAGSKGDKDASGKDNTGAPAQGDAGTQGSKVEATSAAGSDKDATEQVTGDQGDGTDKSKDQESDTTKPKEDQGVDTTKPKEDQGGDTKKPKEDQGGDTTKPKEDLGGDTTKPKEDQWDDTTKPKEDLGGDTTKPKDLDDGNTKPKEDDVDTTKPKEDQGGDTTKPKEEEDEEEKGSATKSRPTDMQFADDNSEGSNSYGSDNYVGSSMSGSGPDVSESFISDNDDDYDSEKRVGAADEERERPPVSHTSGKFTDDPDSHFFAYFLTIMVTAIIFYLVFHNKQRIIALIIEGRAPRSMRTRRASSRAKYHKLDNNFEEAITATKGTNGC